MGDRAGGGGRGSRAAGGGVPDEAGFERDVGQLGTSDSGGLRIGDTVVWMSRDGYIDEINTDFNARGRGSASTALRQITAAADRNHIPLRLEVAASDGGGLNNRQLVSFYTSHGFRPAPGEISGTSTPHMLRLPR